MSRQWMSAAVLAVAVVAGATTPAYAELSKKVSASFKGQLVVTDGDLPSGKSDSDTIEKIKKARLKEVASHPKGDIVAWNFHYTAFLSKTGSNTLTIEFMKGKNQVAANQRLDGIDPKLTILSGDISIDEDEGLAKGVKYTVQLVNGNGVVVSKTELTMK